MTNGTHKKYAIDIIRSPRSRVYTLREPTDEYTIPFLFEAAQFIRDHSSTDRAVIKLLNGEMMEFGPCGTTLSSALHYLYGFFVYGKRDAFLSIIDHTKLDDDGNVQITINPKTLNRGKLIPELSDRNAIAYHMVEMRIYFDTFVSRHLLPEYLAMINTPMEDINRATAVNEQVRIGSMPIRFVDMDGKRISVVQRTHPTLGTGIHDLDFG